MKILNIAIALAVFIGACMLGSENTGGIGALWDAISLAIVVVPSYFLVAAATNSYTFYNDKKSLILFWEFSFRVWLYWNNTWTYIHACRYDARTRSWS